MKFLMSNRTNSPLESGSHLLMQTQVSWQIMSGTEVYSVWLVRWLDLRFCWNILFKHFTDLKLPWYLSWSHIIRTSVSCWKIWKQHFSKTWDYFLVTRQKLATFFFKPICVLFQKRCKTVNKWPFFSLF